MKQEAEEWISIVYYKRWAQMLLSMPAELRHKIHDAIDEYIISRTEPEDASVLYSPFLSIKEQINYDKQLYNERIVKRNRENGNKGGRPKKNPENPVGFKKPKKPKKPDTVTDTVTVPTNVGDKEISTKVDTKKDELSLPVTSAEFEKFNNWLKSECPFVLKLATQMTEKEYFKLTAKYSKEELREALTSLNNWKDFPKRRTNVFRSTLDELKKKYGER